VRPRDGFRPTTPHHAAGSRIEPPMSLACATGTSPAATAAAAPPLDPAVERVVSHGLRHAPKAIGWVVGWQPNSGSAVLPTVTTPAARKRAPRIVSEGARQSSDRNSPLPMYSGRPARQAPTSLSRNGTPDVRQRHNDGVQHRVGGVDAGDRAVRELGRCDLAVGDQIAQRDRIEPPQIVGWHERSLCDLAPTPRSVGRR
jgi:hypothetical protein